MKRTLQNNNQPISNKKRQIVPNINFEDIFETLERHKTLLKNYFENQEIPQDLIESIRLIEQSFINSKRKIEKEKEEMSQKLTALTQNNFQFLDENCLQLIFYNLPNFHLTNTANQIIDCISYSRTCKLFYKISKNTQFPISILKKQITVPFQIFQHILQIPEDVYKKNNQNFILFCARNKLSNIILPTLVQFGFSLEKKQKGYSVLQESITRVTQNLEDFKFLVSFGADVNLLHDNGENCLHLATRQNQPEIVHYLMSIGMEPSLRNADGENCLHLACKFSYLKIARYFIVTMDPDVTNTAGENCLLAASFCPHLVQKVIAINMGRALERWKRRHCKMVKFLIEEIRMSCETTSSNGDNCLIKASKCGSFKVVKFLISSIKMNPNTTNNKGNNCLFEAIKGQHKKFVKYLIFLENLDLDSKNNEGKTALQVAQETDENIAQIIQKKLDSNA